MSTCNLEALRRSEIVPCTTLSIQALDILKLCIGCTIVVGVRNSQQLVFLDNQRQEDIRLRFGCPANVYINIVFIIHAVNGCKSCILVQLIVCSIDSLEEARICTIFISSHWGRLSTSQVLPTCNAYVSSISWDVVQVDAQNSSQILEFGRNTIGVILLHSTP